MTWVKRFNVQGSRLKSPKEFIRRGFASIGPVRLFHPMGEMGQSEFWINGGFFVLNKAVFDYLDGDMDAVMWEQEPMTRLAGEEQLVAYRHRGFWKCMDILRDKEDLETMWKSDPKWKVWD